MRICEQALGLLTPGKSVKDSEHFSKVSYSPTSPKLARSLFLKSVKEKKRLTKCVQTCSQFENKALCVLQTVD